MRVDERRCDRCGKNLAGLPFVVVEMKFHHPKPLDICEECGGSFVLWLGHHPIHGTPASAFLEGRAHGAWSPTAEQIAAHQGADRSALTPEVVRTLREGVKALQRSDVMRGGGRDYSTEDRHERALKALGPDPTLRATQRTADDGRRTER